MALDLTKPVANSKGASAEMRANFTALARSIGGINLIRDSQPIIWPAGDSALPAHYQSTGSPTITRETTIKQFPGMSLKVAAGGAQAVVFQEIVPAAQFTNLFNSNYWSFGCWVYATVAGKVRIAIDDGLTSFTVSTDHPGTSAWVWLSCAGQNSGSSTRLRAQLIVDASNTGYFTGMTFIFGEAPPQHWQPEPCAYGTFYFPTVGNAAVTANKARIIPGRPGIVKDVQLQVTTAPTVQALIVDVNTWDGAAYTSMFSTRPQIAAAAFSGGAQPDSTYARRCFTGGFGSSLPTGGILSYDIDQIGTVAGADLCVHVRALQFISPLEQLLAYNQLG